MASGVSEYGGRVVRTYEDFQRAGAPVQALANRPTLNINWTDLLGTQQQEGAPVKIAALWLVHQNTIKAMSKDVKENILLRGKRVKLALKAKCHQENVNKVVCGGLPLNLSPEIGPNELNFQRLACLVAFWESSRTLGPAEERVMPAMGSCIPSPSDPRFAIFKGMMAPGYAYLCRGLFGTDEHMLPFHKQDGDLGRYLAGAVMLDWLQECQTNKDIVYTMRLYADQRVFEKRLGTMKQIVCNNDGPGGVVFDPPTAADAASFRACLAQDVTPVSGTLALQRVREKFSAWRM